MSKLDADMDRADEFRRLVSARVGCKPEDLDCPRAGSETTPCIARDGRLAVAEAIGFAVCVGCERPVLRSLDEERKRHNPNPERQQ